MNARNSGEKQSSVTQVLWQERPRWLRNCVNAELAGRSGQQGVNTALAQRKQKPCTTTKEPFSETVVRIKAIDHCKRGSLHDFPSNKLNQPLVPSSV